IVALARRVLTERALAAEAGADLSALDARIAATLVPLWNSLPEDVRVALENILGGVLDGGGMPPVSTPPPPVISPGPDAGPPHGGPPSETTPPPTTTEPPTT